jgi:Cu/Ag efflux pump CusA
VVVVGGTISAALLTLVVLPVTFYLACLARDSLERWRAGRTAAAAA